MPCFGYILFLLRYIWAFLLSSPFVPILKNTLYIFSSLQHANITFQYDHI